MAENKLKTQSIVLWYTNNNNVENITKYPIYKTKKYDRILRNTFKKCARLIWRKLGNTMKGHLKKTWVNSKTVLDKEMEYDNNPLQINV